MFNKVIPTFKNFINESLIQSNWRSYTKDTDINVSKEGNDIAQQLVRIFEVNSPDDLIFTSSDISFGNDFMFFFDIIMGGQATMEESKSFNLPGYVVYLNKYNDNKTNLPIVLVNVVENDGTKYSHIFVKKDDIEKFDPDGVEKDEEENSDEESEEKEESSNSQSQGQGQTQGQSQESQETTI